MTKEIRNITSDMEVRSLGEYENPVITGYALKFNRWSDTLGGWFRELLEPESLRDADMSNVVALFNHDNSKILGRVGKNLTLTVDVAMCHPSKSEAVLKRSHKPVPQVIFRLA